MPSRSLATRTCTFSQSLHIGDEVACAAGRRELERKNRPAGTCQLRGNSPAQRGFGGKKKRKKKFGAPPPTASCWNIPVLDGLRQSHSEMRWEHWWLVTDKALACDRDVRTGRASRLVVVGTFLVVGDPDTVPCRGLGGCRGSTVEGR